MSLSEKAAYLRGLAEGMELDEKSKEARLIKEMIELLGEMASDVEDVASDVSELYDAFEEIDEDLAMVEEEVFGDDEHMHDHPEVYEITCPACGDTVVLEEDMLFGGDIVCPGCNEKIEIEIDECDCGCSHDHGHDDDHE